MNHHWGRRSGRLEAILLNDTLAQPAGRGGLCILQREELVCLFNYKQQHRQPCNTLAVIEHLVGHALHCPHTSEHWENRAWLTHTWPCMSECIASHREAHTSALHASFEKQIEHIFLASHGLTPGRCYSFLTCSTAHTFTCQTWNLSYGKYIFILFKSPTICSSPACNFQQPKCLTLLSEK